jgi:hypothetical protein
MTTMGGQLVLPLHWMGAVRRGVAPPVSPPRRPPPVNNPSSSSFDICDDVDVVVVIVVIACTSTAAPPLADIDDVVFMYIMKAMPNPPPLSSSIAGGTMRFVVFVDFVVVFVVLAGAGVDQSLSRREFNPARSSSLSTPPLLVTRVSAVGSAGGERLLLPPRPSSFPPPVSKEGDDEGRTSRSNISGGNTAPRDSKRFPPRPLPPLPPRPILAESRHERRPTSTLTSTLDARHRRLLDPSRRRRHRRTSHKSYPMSLLGRRTRRTSTNCCRIPSTDP